MAVSLLDLKDRLRNFISPVQRAATSYVNRVAKPMAVGVPQAQKAVLRGARGVADYFNPKEQNRYVDTVFNKMSNIPRYTLPQRLPGNFLPTDTQSKPINFLSVLGRTAIESPLNIPRNLITGYSRLNQEQLKLLRGKGYNFGNALAGAGNLGEAALDLGGIPIGKGIANRAILNTAKEGAKSAIKKGITQGALVGAVGGGTYGMGNQYNKPFNLGEVAFNTAGGAVLGGALGGAISGLGSIKKNTTYSQRLLEQLRDAKGRWMKDGSIVWPKGINRHQKAIMIQINEKLGRSPFEPVYSSDLQQAIDLGLSVRAKGGAGAILKAEAKKSAQAGLYDTGTTIEPFKGVKIPKTNSPDIGEIAQDSGAMSQRIKESMMADIEKKVSPSTSIGGGMRGRDSNSLNYRDIYTQAKAEYPQILQKAKSLGFDSIEQYNTAVRTVGNDVAKLKQVAPILNEIHNLEISGRNVPPELQNRLYNISARGQAGRTATELAGSKNYPSANLGTGSNVAQQPFEDVTAKVQPRSPGNTRILTRPPSSQLKPISLSGQSLPSEDIVSQRGMTNVLDEVKGAIYSGDKNAAKALYETLPGNKPRFEDLVNEVEGVQNSTLKEASQGIAPKYGEYQDVVNKFKSFLSLAGEKKSRQTGELFREHIPQSVTGVSSDEVASVLGKTENEFMAEITSDLQIAGSGRSTPQVMARIKTNVDKIRQLYEKLNPNIFEVHRDELGRPNGVSYIGGLQQVGKIAKERIATLERTANKNFDEWEKQLFRQTGATKPSKLVRDAIAGMKENTSSPFTKDTAQLKDISGVSGYFRDMHRNFQKVFGKYFQGAKEAYLDPLFVGAKGRYLKDQEVLIKELDDTVIKGYGIKPNSAESEAVQLFGEKQITQLDLIDKFGKEKASKIMEADTWFRQKYNTLLQEVNRVRSVMYPNSPEKLIPRRQDYYRHFKELAEGYKALFNIFETPAGVSSKLAGVSYQTKPKSKWLSIAQRRLGIKTEVDAVGGFLNYIKASSYAKHIDPQIERFRSLADELASATAEGERAGSLNNFILSLNRFADDLAGKTNPIDRVAQEIGGRKIFRVLDWANTRVKANTILYNLSSSVAQIFNVPNGIADAGPINAAKGLGRSLADIFYPNNPAKESIFLKERYFRAYDKFDTGLMQNAKKLGAWIVTVLDEVGTKYIWNAEYSKALSQKIKNPVVFADDATRALVAGRGIGEVPLGQKSRIFQMVAPFQLEVSNLWWVMKDMVDAKQFGKLATLFLANYVFNKGAEKIRGSGVSFDPIQAIVDAYNTFNEEENKGIGGLRAGGRIAGEVLSNVPIGQTLAAAYPEYGFKIPGTEETLTRKEFFGREDPTRFGGGLLVAKGIQDPLYKLIPPFGGVQIKKSLQGAEVAAKGYSESAGGRVQFPVENSPLKTAQMLAFGKYSTPEARAYFDNNRTPLGDKQSELFKQSADKQGVYNQIIGAREVKASETKVKDQIKKNEGGSELIGKKYYYWNDETGEVESLNLDFNVEKPKLTNSEATNKELVSTYKSKISTAINNVRKANEIGLISDEEMIKEIERLATQYSSTLKGKKPKKVTIKQIKFPSQKSTIAKSKLGSFKMTKPKLAVIKQRKIKLPKMVLKKPTYKVAKIVVK